ncbi:MAG: GNAT family N-acetyltransferase [Anaerolineae bacterium]|nr:GNAT family N-acetyltransferase [Anaerolineae bacterium]
MSTYEIERIAELEWANYAATAAIAQITPGLELILRPDAILSSSEIFPTPDVNHACLLRADSQGIDALIDEMVGYYQAKDLLPTIFVSPACTPADLAERLLARGFARQEGAEAWMVVDDIWAAQIPKPSPRIEVREIEPEEALTVAQVFMTAFDMSLDFAPAMAQLLAPSVGLPGAHHYLAFLNDEPVGTCSLICHQTFGVLGSAGVIPSRRGGSAATNLAVRAVFDARQEGVRTLMLQTAAGTLLERFLRIYGFKTAFTRTGYTLQ